MINSSDALLQFLLVPLDKSVYQVYHVLFHLLILLIFLETDRELVSNFIGHNTDQDLLLLIFIESLKFGSSEASLGNISILADDL